MSAIYDRSQKIIFLHPKTQNGLVLKNSVILKANTIQEEIRPYTPKTLIIDEKVQKREPLRSLREEIECRKREFQALEEAQTRIQFMLGELEKVLKRKK